MKPAPFEYAAPDTLGEALSLLQQHADEDVKLLAGGQSLVPLLSMRMARPELLVDLNGIEELQYIREEGDWLAIGAMTRKRAVEQSELVQRRQPVLVEGTRLVAHPQIRNRGTVGGSMAHADPASEYPALALALGAELRAVGPDGERSIAAADFFQSYLTTALEPLEVLTEVRVPALPEGVGWSFTEVARRHGDYALGGAVTTLRLDGDAIAEPSLVLFAMGPTPVRMTEVEAMLAGQRPSDELFQEAGRVASRGIEEPMSDVHATAEYRRHLAGVLTGRALREALERAGGTS
jgi:carbon-monoxide dehydrogenase medium subunit